jgi:hypothetical protein
MLNGNFPACIIQWFEEVFEKILKELNTGGELHIDVAIILKDQPGNVRNNESILFLLSSMFEISWK